MRITLPAMARNYSIWCERDLEGIVAKHRHSHYSTEDGNPAWVKIKNARYSQVIGRDELFERKYEAEAASEIGWDVGAKSAAARA